MAQTLDDRQKVSRDLEDIHNSAGALIEKVARAQMELEGSDDDVAESLGGLLSSLSQTAETVQSLRSDFDMETARRQNEGEL
jgi:uncharacterized transporter YbjL